MRRSRYTIEGWLTGAIPTIAGLILAATIVSDVVIVWSLGPNAMTLAWILAGSVAGFSAAAGLAALYLIVDELGRIREAADFMYEKARTGK